MCLKNLTAWILMGFNVLLTLALICYIVFCVYMLGEFISGDINEWNWIIFE